MTPDLDPARVKRAAVALADDRADVRPGPDPGTWIVSSFTGDESYFVDLESGTCTCPDNRIRGGTCKHRALVALTKGLT